MGTSAGKGVLRKIKKFEDNIIKPYLRWQYSYNMQYLDRATLIEIIGLDAARASLMMGGDGHEKEVFHEWQRTGAPYEAWLRTERIDRGSNPEHWANLIGVSLDVRI